MTLVSISSVFHNRNKLNFYTKNSINCNITIRAFLGIPMVWESIGNAWKKKKKLTSLQIQYLLLESWKARTKYMHLIRVGNFLHGSFYSNILRKLTFFQLDFTLRLFDGVKICMYRNSISKYRFLSFFFLSYMLWLMIYCKKIFYVTFNACLKHLKRTLLHRLSFLLHHWQFPSEFFLVSL